MTNSKAVLIPVVVAAASIILACRYSHAEGDELSAAQAELEGAVSGNTVGQNSKGLATSQRLADKLRTEGGLDSFVKCRSAIAPYAPYESAVGDFQEDEPFIVPQDPQGFYLVTRRGAAWNALVPNKQNVPGGPEYYYKAKTASGVTVYIDYRPGRFNFMFRQPMAGLSDQDYVDANTNYIIDARGMEALVAHFSRMIAAFYKEAGPVSASPRSPEPEMTPPAPSLADVCLNIQDPRIIDLVMSEKNKGIH